MTPVIFNTTILSPAIAWCQSVPDWKIPFDERARVLLLTIAGQEGGWEYRVQAGNGPAHGFWQFERLGGVVGVLGNQSSAQLAYNACETAGVDHSAAVWSLMATEKGDGLACAFARLLLWSDPAPLPALGLDDAAWDYYQRNWRPGAPDRDRWTSCYQQALNVLAVEGKDETA